MELIRKELRPGDPSRSLAVAILILALPGAAYFVVAYGRNSADIQFQHIQTAEALSDGRYLPVRTAVALHDAGALTYFGNYRVLDLEGLTSPEFRKAGRLGSAGIWERLERIPPSERPDVLAVYPSWFDPAFLASHSLVHSQRLFRPSIAAGNPLNLYAADWSLAGRGDRPRDPAVGPYLSSNRLIGEVDVADVQSEEASGYKLHVLDGAYESVIRQLPSGDGEAVLEGGRLVSGGESFIVRGARARQPIILVTRTHAPFRVRVLVDEKLAGVWTEMGDKTGWREPAFVVPAETIASQEVRIRILTDDPHHAAYGSFHYWIFQQ